MPSERESAIHFKWFRNETDSLSSILQLTKNMLTSILNAHLDFFSCNWVVFARSDQKCLPRMNKICQKRKFYYVFTKYNLKYFWIKCKLIINIVDIISCKFKFFEDYQCFKWFKTQDLNPRFKTMDLGNWKKEPFFTVQSQIEYTGCERYWRPFFEPKINLHKIFKNNNRLMKLSEIVYLYLDFTFSRWNRL